MLIPLLGFVFLFFIRLFSPLSKENCDKNTSSAKLCIDNIYFIFYQFFWHHGTLSEDKIGSGNAEWGRRTESLKLKAESGEQRIPDGHFKIPHLWPGQNPPPEVSTYPPATGQNEFTDVGLKDPYFFPFSSKVFPFAFNQRGG